jgi:ABC-type multidrug transport system fused ATPase/permease subunit
MSWARLMTKFLFDIRSAIFQKVLSYRGEKLTNLYSGDLIARMNYDVAEFMNFIHWNVFYTIGGILNLLLSLGFIFYLNGWIGLFTLALTPLIVYTSRKFSKMAKKFYQEIAEKNGLLSSWLFEIMKGMQEIRLLGAAKNVLSDYVGKTVKIMRLQIKSGSVEIAAERVNAGISLLAQMVLYVISAIFIINGNLTVGGFTACVSYFGTCTAVFNTLNNKVVNIAANMVSIDRVADILNETSEQYNSHVPNITIEKGDISFSDVWFRYQNEIDVLKSISFRIAPGERVALVGHSGAGKTTIANLLYKLYETDCGTICIDGINVNEYNLHNLRDQIGIVHQETILFDGTIRFNLSFSNDQKVDNQLWKALKMAHLDAYIATLPSGLDTQIGSGGIAFSGGQKQRLAIARIFVKNPKILIFDEATSSLDHETEGVITSCWEELCKDRTILVIAHRLSTILNSDKVAVIADGRIVGFEHHRNLLETCPAYVELFQEQYSHSEVIESA